MRSTAADLDVSPELAARLLTLSDGARRHEARDGRIDAGDVRGLLEVLLDDELCRHGWWVAAVEGERLWRLLVERSRPPHDIGPAVLLAVSLARRSAADEALAVIRTAIRPREFRRSAIEIGIDLAEDAGRPDLAWDLVVKLGRPDPVAQWGALWCVLVCSGGRSCPRSRLVGATHARWLRQRLYRWARRPWSGCLPAHSSGGAEPELRLRRYEEDPVALAAVGYLESRASLLPAGERRLLSLWSGVRQASAGRRRVWSVRAGRGRRRQAAGRRLGRHCAQRCRGRAGGRRLVATDARAERASPGRFGAAGSVVALTSVCRGPMEARPMRGSGRPVQGRSKIVLAPAVSSPTGPMARRRRRRPRPRPAPRPPGAGSG